MKADNIFVTFNTVIKGKWHISKQEKYKYIPLRLYKHMSHCNLNIIKICLDVG